MRLMRLAAAGVLAALLPTLAQADQVDSLRLPESIPGITPEARSYDVLNPPAVNSSWARIGHRPLGVNLANFNLTVEQIEAVSQTGCGLVRLNIPFEPFFAALDETGQPLADASANWLALDQVVSRLRRHGLEILPVLTVRVVPDLRQFQRFCSALAQRYGPTFSHYQILDNINFMLGLPSQEYADLVSSARISIITADPGALIVSGGIRGCDLTYLELLEANGALRSLDVLAFNLYPPADGIERVSQRPMRLHSLPFVEQLMTWARQRGKPVWVSSFGVPTSYGDEFDAGVDQVAQASIYARGAILLGYLGAERIIFASIQDTDPENLYPAACCGILDVRGAPKASYFALTALAQLVSGAFQVEPEFMVDQVMFQRLTEADLFNAAGGMDTQGRDPLATFQVRGMPVYAFWLYNPGLKEYRLVYWLGSDLAAEFLISLTLFDPDMDARTFRQLLDTTPSPVRQMRAANLTSVQFQPLSTIPSVISYEVRPHGSGS